MRMTSGWKVHLSGVILVLVAMIGNVVAKSETPQFRHVDSGVSAALGTRAEVIKLLTDDNFAPFSFKNAGNEMVGVSVELAQAACAEMRVKCIIIAKPFNDLLPALERNEGDAIISGFRITKAIIAKATVTRPYFFSMGQFITRVGMPFETPDVRSLAGRRVGFVKGTSHQAFLEKYFDRAALTPFENEASLFEALRTGGLDVVFADSLHAQFWLKGSISRKCCTPLGTGFIDRTTFSRGLSFLVRRDQESLREGFDYALDRLQTNGVSAKIFTHYFPDFAF